MAAPGLVVFDCDGTLLDAQAGILQAMDTAFVAAGLPSPLPNAVRRVIGLSLDIAVSRLVPAASAALIRAVAGHYRDAFSAMRRQSGLLEPLYPGAVTALDDLRAAGLLLGIATGKGKRGLRAALEQHGLIDRFVTLQTADDAASKPAPEMLLRAMAETGMAPMRTLMIGDTSFDMAMAQAARVRALGVAWGYHPPDELRASGAAEVLEDFAELPDAVHRYFKGLPA